MAFSRHVLLLLTVARETVASSCSTSRTDDVDHCESSAVLAPACEAHGQAMLQTQSQRESPSAPISSEPSAVKEERHWSQAPMSSKVSAAKKEPDSSPSRAASEPSMLTEERHWSQQPHASKLFAMTVLKEESNSSQMLAASDNISTVKLEGNWTQMPLSSEPSTVKEEPAFFQTMAASKLHTLKDFTQIELALIFVGCGLLLTCMAVVFMHVSGVSKKENPSMPQGPGGNVGQTWVRAPSDGAPAQWNRNPPPGTPAQQDRMFGCCR